MPTLRRPPTLLALSVLVLCFLALPAVAEGDGAGSEIFRSPRTAVQLVAEQTSVRPGEPLRVGLRFDLTEEWHVYWRNPGDSGTAPAVVWELPEGWSAGEFQWPVPERIPVGPFVNFGYEGEIVLPVLLDPGASASRISEAGAADHLRVVADAEWLVCREECIPESSHFTLDLPVGEEAPRPSAWAKLFAEADDRQPVELPGIESTIRDLGDGTLKLEIRYPADLDLASSEIELFPEDPTAIEHAASVEIEAGGDGDLGSGADRRQTLILQRSPFADGEVESLDGVLVARSQEPRDQRAVALVIEARAPRLSEPANGDLDSAAASAAEAAGARRPGIAAALGLAFLGGVLLNLMPCVFPVLSIKVLGLLGHREDPAAGRRHGLFFAAGILVSFWALAGVLLGLRAAGSAVGWGFQLQSPAFVGFLALLFFALGLNFLGVFELGQRLAGHAASAVTKGEGASGSFWSGVLATAVATPCTAPFMGSAIGFATVVAPIVALAVFTALGLGMAAPYVALVYFPAALRRLPRPGPWMETLKQFMAFPLFATVLWLLWVLAAQRGASGVLVVLTALLLAGFAGWLAPRLGRTGSKALKGAGVVLATLSAAGAVLLVLSPTFFDSSVGAESVETAARDGLEWQPWTPELVASLRAEGRPVYVDFTARWCLTCQVNKRVVFGSDRVLEEFEQRNVALVRGDWTNQDPRITAALEEHGRSGVPLNLFYPADATAPPEVLPTVLSPDIVLQVIRSSGDPRSLDPSNQSNSQGDSTI